VNRAALHLLAIGGAAITATPVLASPAPLDAGRSAAVRITAQLPDERTLELDIRGDAFSGGSRLTIDALRCEDDACSSRTYISNLPEGALTVDPSEPTAELRTTLAGRPLVIRWTAANDNTLATVGGAYVSGEGGQTAAGDYTGNSAIASVGFGDQRCERVGAVGTGVGATVDDPTESDGLPAVSALRIADGATLRC